jgi:hypothetical protein
LSFLRGSRSTRLPSGRVLQLAAIVALIALLIGLAINANGFDVKNVNLTNHNIWILQKVNPKTKNQDEGRYARVNTQVNELGLKNSVKKPSEIFQSLSGSLLFNREPSFINISSASPVDFNADTEGVISLPSASLSTEMNFGVSALVDSARSLRVSVFNGSIYPAPVEVKLPNGVSKSYGFDAVAVSLDGLVYAFSTTDSTVRKYDPVKQEWLDLKEQVTGARPNSFQLAAIGNRWALLELESSKLWVQGSANPEPVADGSYLQKSGAGSNIYLSSLTGLQVFDTGSRQLATAQDVAGALETSRPIEFGNSVFASWLSSDRGWFYDSSQPALQPLNFNNKTLDAVQLQKPTTDLNLVSNGESAIINETYSGWAWSLPSGELVSGSQNWDGDPPPVKNCETNCPPPDQIPPRPKDDSFGVRAGQLISLPVLINDSDTNLGDVITIDPESVKGLDPGFGEVRTSSNEQMLTVAVSANARGTQTFRYQITDGVSPKLSRAATVTLHVVAPGTNNAPGWCTDVVNDCIQELPDVRVEPGAEVSVPFLDAWVDPDGDRFFIESAVITSGDGILAFSGDGELVYQNDNGGSKKSESVTAKVVVSDVKGAKVTKTLVIQVTPKIGSQLSVPVIVTAIEEPLTIDFSKFVSGSNGEVAIATLLANDANKNSGLKIEPLDDSKAQFTSSTVGPAIIDLTMNDAAGAKLSQTFRINFVDPTVSELATSPVTALVSPNLDTSIDIFAAAHNPTHRALVVSGIEVQPVSGATISADKIKGGFIRIRGKNSQNSLGFVGVVNYKLSDGSADAKFNTTGQIFVYEMADPDSSKPVARHDSVVVRAGDTASVDVLSNDLGNPGVPLVIDSKSLKQNAETSCIKGGLIFAGGGKLRLVAPKKAGLYNCPYSIYPINNTKVRSTGYLSIRVQSAAEGNHAPQPVNLYARVRAGETVNIPVPIVGVDPDGDQVAIRSIGDIKGDKGGAYVNPDSSSLEYSAVAGVSGQDSFTYTLVDSKGLVSGTALVKIAILDSKPDTAPATLNDYAEVLVGADNKVVIDPVSNDFDPQPDTKNPISLVKGSIKPEIPIDSKLYAIWAKQIKTINGNLVTIAAGTSPTVMHFQYRAKSSSGSESFGSITINVTSDAVDDAPDVTDTFVTQAEQRDALTTSGIDVVSNKILWASGDVNKLTLSVWGGLDGFKVISNSNLTAAAIPNESGIVIFKVSGTNFYGKEVESYGFMHLPGLTPKITFDPVKSLVRVAEGASKTFDIAADVNLPGQIEVGKVSVHGLRDKASCKVKSGTVIEYSAGSGAPWTDFCDVQIRVSGTSESYTTILVPIKVIPTNPEPVLTGRQLTIAPGADNAQVTELKTMTTWEGKTEEDKNSLQYVLEGGNDIFEITRKGTEVTIKLRGSAPVGAIRKVKVSISNHPNTEPVELTLIVGQLTSSPPIGATLALECSVNDSIASCAKNQSDLNNGQGVYNPFEGTDLTYAPFGYSTGAVNYASGTDYICGDVKLRTTATSISAKWSQVDGKKASGAKCTITYRVIDKAGRLGSGVLEFTFRGVPGAVRSVTQVDYSATTVTLQIVPPSMSFPVIENFEIVQDGGQAFPCQIDEGATFTRCVIRNLKAYDGTSKSNLHKYSVRARNSEGISNVPRVLEGAYAFKAPKPLTDNNIRAKTIYDPAATTSVGYALVTIYPVADPSVKSYSVSSDVVGSQTEVTFTDTANSKQVKIPARPGMESVIRVSAVGDVKPPIGTIADAGSSAFKLIRIAATPKVASVSFRNSKSATGIWTAKVTATDTNRNFSEKSSRSAFILYTGNTKPRCDWDPTTNDIGVTSQNGGTAIVDKQTDSPTDTQLQNIESAPMTIEDNASYTPMVCFANSYGIASAVGKTMSTLSDPAEGQFKFAVNPNPVDGAWLVALTASGTGNGVFAQFNGSKTDPNDWRNYIYSTYFGEDSIIKVRYCKTGTTICSSGNRLVTPSDVTRSWQLKITTLDAMLDVAAGTETTKCERSKDLDFKLSGQGLVSPSGTTLWQLSEDSSYVATNGATGALSKPGDYYRIPLRSASAFSKLVLKFQGRDSNTSPHVSGLTGTVTLEFACR